MVVSSEKSRHRDVSLHRSLMCRRTNPIFQPRIRLLDAWLDGVVNNRLTSNVYVLADRGYSLCGLVPVQPFP